MRQKYDTYFATLARLERDDLSGKERLESLNTLSQLLTDWGTHVFSDESFDWYLHYKEHGTLPYPGSLMEQPMYVRRDLTLWMRVEQWHRLNEQLPSVEGLPTIEDFT